ncbi:MAG: carboxymuconolactone decarboxylase family protein [Ktedonobacterales bacterium]
MTRLPYPDPDHVYGAMRRLPERLQTTSFGRMLSYAPSAVESYYRYSAVLLDQLELAPRVRQLAILRVAYLTEAWYVWSQQVALARMFGVRDEEILAVQARDIPEDILTGAELLALAFTTEVLRTTHVSDTLFEVMRTRFSEREIVELLLVIGWYWAAGRLTTTLELEPEPALGVRTQELLNAARSSH